MIESCLKFRLTTVSQIATHFLKVWSRSNPYSILLLSGRYTHTLYPFDFYMGYVFPNVSFALAVFSRLTY